MRIGYFADGPWAHKAFQKLIADSSIEIAFICVRYDIRDNVLKEYAERYGIDFLYHRNINSDAFTDKVKEYRCDLFVSMSFNQIFKKEIIFLPPLTTINCHAGKLPFYRGRNILNWVLINDEKEFGITVHYVDEGIDTGDIILQKTHEITDEDDYNTLLHKAYSGCADALYESIKMIQNNHASRVKQSSVHPVGMYCGMRRVGDEMIDWNSTSRELFNFIRAICKPAPMAQSMLNGKTIKINKSEMIAEAPCYKGVCGEVVGTAKDSFTVKTKDTTLKITEYEYDGKIKIGDRMG